LRTTRNTIVDQDSKITILTTQIDEVQHEKDLMQLDVDNYKKQVVNLVNEVDMMNDNNSLNELKDTIEKQREVIQNLQKKEIQYQTDIQNLKINEQTSTRIIDNTINTQLDNRNEEYEQQIQDLLNKISEKDTQIEELIEVQKETAEIFNLENAEELRKRMEDYENTIIVLKQEIEEKKSSFGTSKKRIK